MLPLHIRWCDVHYKLGKRVNNSAANGKRRFCSPWYYALRSLPLPFCSPLVGQGCSYLKTGLAEGSASKITHVAVTGFRSHGLWTAGHCSWSPCVDTSITWLAVWQLTSPRVSDLQEGEGKSKQERTLQVEATVFVLPNLGSVTPLLLSHPIHYMRVCKCCLLPCLHGEAW